MAQKKAKPKTQRAKMPRNYKAAVSAVTKYREMRAAGQIGKIMAMEELSKFVGAKGNVLQRAVRYDKGIREFAAAVAKVKKDVGKRAGKKTLLRYVAKARGKLEKATKTYVEKQIPDKRFKKKAREQANKYAKMVDIFASETFNQLRSGEYGLGSDIVGALAESGFTPDDIEDYLQQVKGALDEIPNEARAMSNNDDFWKTVVEITDAFKSSADLNVSDVINAYLTTESDREEFTTALENYISVDNRGIPFSRVWEVLSSSLDPTSPDNMEEVIEMISEGEA